MLAEALEHLVRGIVTHPDDVAVRDKDLRRGRMLEVRVNPEDIGKVIGRPAARPPRCVRSSARSPAATRSGSTSSTWTSGRAAATRRRR